MIRVSCSCKYVPYSVRIDCGSAGIPAHRSKSRAACVTAVAVARFCPSFRIYSLFSHKHDSQHPPCDIEGVAAHENMSGSCHRFARDRGNGQNRVNL
jgi:hypothetical protein